MTQVRIQRDGNRVTLSAPYCPELPDRARALGGRWDGSVWTFDARDEQRVRALARDIYGTDGEDHPELVTVRIRITRQLAAGRELWLAGRLVARRQFRDSAVRLGEGVIVAEGEFPRSGGSMKHPALWGDGVVLEVRGVPRPAVPQAPNIEIVEEATVGSDGEDDPLAGYTDEQLIAALERRGYVVIRAAANSPA